MNRLHLSKRSGYAGFHEKKYNFKWLFSKVWAFHRGYYKSSTKIRQVAN